MSRSLFVHFLPSLISAEQLNGQAAVVIDILRASTTIVQALAAGVIEVHPYREVDEARRASAELSRPVLLGGERGGQKIKGFDLDNSPWNYTPEVCEGRRLVFTTTNGTRALDVCREAAVVHLGAFTNLSTLANALLEMQTDIHLVCAGTDGEITFEDVLFAGVLSRKLLDGAPGSLRAKNDSARIACSLPSLSLETAHPLWDLLHLSRGGENLIELGFDRDLEWASRIDSAPLLAFWDPVSNRITRR